MERLNVLGLFMCLLAMACVSPEAVTRTVIEPEATVEITYLQYINTGTTSLEHYYYWFDNGEIQKTKGDYIKNPLNGNYLRYDIEDRLMQKGEYRKGLKAGLWKSWYPNGELRSVEEFRSGRLHGTQHYYAENGELRKIQQNKGGELHGIQVEMRGDSIVSKSKYRKGLLQREKKDSTYSRILFYKKETFSGDSIE